jgi:hypothetical protein
MLFIFSTPELIRNLWQLKTAVFLHWCLLRGVPLPKICAGFCKTPHYLKILITTAHQLEAKFFKEILKKL